MPANQFKDFELSIGELTHLLRALPRGLVIQKLYFYTVFVVFASNFRLILNAASR
jgi:hypothetical protein